MRRRIDLTGQKFGRLTVVEWAKNNDSGAAHWRCICSCGNETIVRGWRLRKGGTKSCGCKISALLKAHGLSKTSTYVTFKKMHQRCCNPKDPKYKDYGARGIEICARWLNNFTAFLEDMGIKPDGHSIERNDVNGPYSPENCCWLPVTEQAKNTRKSVRITLDGETLCLNDWARRFEISPFTVQTRLRKGWDIENALRKPVDATKRNSRYTGATTYAA